METIKEKKPDVTPLKMLEFLEEQGYRTYNMVGTMKYVQINKSVVRIVSKEELQAEVLKHFRKESASIYNAIARDKSLFTTANLLALKKLENNWLNDTATEIYIPYQNGIVKSTLSGVSLLPYDNLKMFIWKHDIRDREVNIDIPLKPNFSFHKFLNNISGENFNSLLSVIGYLISRYRSKRLSKAVIFYDEVSLHSNQPNGGTGKGILKQAVAFIRLICELNGKEFKNKGKFKYEQLTPFDHILVIDDVSNGFDFTELFSVITESISVDSKNNKPFIIPFEQAPIILISSNYPIAGSNSSHNRRRFEFELVNHYSDKHQPHDDFGHEFFHDWCEKQWNQFDLLMIRCTQTFLKHGLIQPNYNSAKLRSLIKESSREFAQWAISTNDKERYTNIPLGVRLNTVKIRNQFISDTGISISGQKFREHLQAFCNNQNLFLSILKSNGREYFIINIIHSK